MSELQRVTTITGAGTLAHSFLPKLRIACNETGATKTLLAQGGVELNRMTASLPTTYGRDGVIDVSPSPHELQTALGFLGDDEVAEENRPVWQQIANGTVQKIVQAYQNAALEDGQLLWFQGLRTGHGLIAKDELSEIHRSLPHHHILVSSVLPEDYEKRLRLRDGGWDRFVQLQDAGIIETTILIDNDSPFALTYKLNVQDQFQAKAYASMLAAQFHFGKNSSIAEIGHSLREYTPFVGMAFASRSLVRGKGIPWWDFPQKLFPALPDRGTGELRNIVREAQHATTEALTNPLALGIDETIDLRKPLYILYTVPLRYSDRRWEQFSNEIRRWLRTAYPTATPLFASANGTPDPRYPGAFWLQASVLFPLPEVPAPIRAILELPNLKRPTSATSSTSGAAANGRRAPEDVLDGTATITPGGHRA